MIPMIPAEISSVMDKSHSIAVMNHGEGQ